MSVQARFFVQSITKNAMDQLQVTMRASGRGGENKSWAQYTPSGTLEMLVNNPDAAKWFEDHLGKDVALYFEERPVVCPECKEETGVRLTAEHQMYVEIECPNGHRFNPEDAGYPPKER